MEPEHVDVIVVGAGLSGIGAACHLARRLPDKTFAVLEARAATGGTWDLFRYPGVRSDSEMFTLGYAFRPWRGARGIADGAGIRDYIRSTAAEHGVQDKIRLGHRVTAAERRRALDAHDRAFGDGRMAERAGVPHTVLTHLIPAPTTSEAEAEFASDLRDGGYAGRITVGRDLLTFDLADGR